MINKCFVVLILTGTLGVSSSYAGGKKAKIHPIARTVGPIASTNFESRELEKILEINEYIPFTLNPNIKKSVESISHIPVSQKAWALVMGNNPSQYSTKEYCPETFQILEVRGSNGNQPLVRYVQMCPDHPVDSVSARARRDNPDGSLNEFLKRINDKYRESSLPTRFRVATLNEYRWFETQGGQNQMGDFIEDYGRYGTCYENSEFQSTLPKRIRFPSGKSQTFPARSKEPIATFVLSDGSPRSFWLGGGVWEWTSSGISWTRSEGLLGDHLIVAGKGWDISCDTVQMGNAYSFFPLASVPTVGAGRLVKTQDNAKSLDSDFIVPGYQETQLCTSYKSGNYSLDAPFRESCSTDESERVTVPQLDIGANF